MKDKSSLKNIILTQFPYPIAVRYQRMLEEESPELKSRRCIDIYEAGLRALTLGILGQYIQHDSKVINDPTLNKVALELINVNRPPVLGTWQRVFFTALKAYEDHRDRFFMPELYDFYWDTSVAPHRPHRNVQKPFQRLVELRNGISHSGPVSTAYWQSLYEEIDGCLHEVLAQLLFLAEYDLIRILEKGENGYDYEVYTGQHIKRADFLQTEKHLKEGWCYLSKTTGELLTVHPLIIFWEDELGQKDLHEEPEVVVYDSYKIQQIKYWHSASGRLETQNPGLLDQFISLIVEKLEAQRPQREVYHLSWRDLKVLSSQIAVQRMGDARNKYNERLYLQRQETRETFDKFLKTDKGCLILTGSSGVGKSNFLISLIEEFQESDEVCTLAYNGARLDPMVPIENIMAQDFNHHLKLRSREQPDGPAILKMIDELEDIGKRRVILFVDAINENADGKALLRQLDRFVENRSYPWLKVVITSRPEAWQNIKRGVRLAEHRYYRQTGKDDLGIEITGFTTSDYEIRVEPFAYEELPRVYEKYRQAYGLVTTYEDVPAVIKKLLRDPLTLLLTAETYRNREIPMHLRPGELIEKYIQRLVDTERLSENDLHFLRQEIVPRLFTPPYSPTLQRSDIENEFTADNRPLYELVINDDLLPNGRRVNQSYTNLADNAILVKQVYQTEQAIGFKYERFYEHFGGIYLSKTASEVDSAFEFYKNLSGLLNNKPYLWGALKNSIFNELKKGNLHLVHELARVIWSSDRLFRTVLISSLIDFYETEKEIASNLINDMAQPISGPAYNIFETTKRFLFRKHYDDLLLKPEQSIALEVAGQLGLEKLLCQAATDRVRAVRLSAILHIFYLWRHDKEAGYRIMYQLSEHAVAGWDLPDFGTIDALTSLIISMITYDHLDPEMQKHALQVSRQVLRKILFLNSVDHQTIVGRLRFLIWKQIRRPLLSFAINWGLKVFASWETDELPANLATLSTFFTLPEADKESATFFIAFFDPYKPGLMEHINEIMGVEEIGDLMALNMAQQVPLIARAQVNFEEALTTLRELTRCRLDEEHQVLESYIWMALQIALRQYPPHPELLEIAESCTLCVQSDPYKWLADHNTLRKPWLHSLATGISSYMVLNHLCNGAAISQPLRNWVERAIEKKDIVYLRDYIRELRITFDIGYYKIALEGLELVANFKHPQIEQDIADLLIQIRHYFPEDVEDILLQEVFPENINQRAWNSLPLEHVNDLLGLRAIGIFYDLFLLGPEILRQETIWLASQAEKMPDLETWVTLVIKEILNLAANEVIFPVSQDAPSKRLLDP